MKRINYLAIAMLGMMSGSVLAATGNSLTVLTDSELSAETGQALFNMSYIGPGGSNPNVDTGFYKLGMEAQLDLNANIKKLQLGCGGVKGAGCDIDLDNPRELPMQITYSPIFNLEKYRKLLESQDKSPEYVRQHIDIIKRQGITQILYLPEGGNLKYDGIVFLDRINNCSNNAISRDNLRERRLFTLSNYGLYLFLLKISIHFSRIQEKIDRNTGVII